MIYAQETAENQFYEIDHSPLIFIRRRNINCINCDQPLKDKDRIFYNDARKRGRGRLVWWHEHKCDV